MNKSSDFKDGFILILIIVSPLFFIAIKDYFRRKRYKKWKSYLIQKVSDHSKTLGIKRKQILTLNDYGHIEDKKWKRWWEEIGIFLESIHFPPLHSFLSKYREEFLQIIEGSAERSSNNLIFDSHNVSPLEYETMCSEILSEAGWITSTTKGSGDQGVDVIAEKGGRKVVLQCKRYSYPVGNKAVQEIVAGKSFYRADIAAVVSNQSFTPSAKELAQSTGVLLLHHEMLSDLESMI